jgi:hypothetical protein
MSLYEDDFVRLEELCITLKLYYFPVGDKTIPRQSIASVESLENPGLFDTKMWGMALSNVWWAFGWKLNIESPKKLMIIKTTDDDWIRKGFVCCDAAAFMTAYRLHEQR